MRRFVVSIVCLLSIGLNAACSGGSGGTEDDPPPLAQATVTAGSSSSPSPSPSSTRTPGPPVTAVCKLLTGTEVASAVAMTPAPSTSEQKLTDSAHSCRYQSGTRYVQLIVATEPASGTAKAAADRVVARYSGTLDEIPGLGDAAYYTGDATIQTVVVVRLEGTQMRSITLIGFLGRVYKDQLVTLARTVLERS